MLDVLSTDDLRFWDENGYVVVHDAVPPDNCRAVIDAIFEFLGMNPDDPDDWYREPHRHGGMIEMYHHPAMWANRSHPRVHGAFADIWKAEKLWCSIDRVNMKPPVRPDQPDWDHKGFIHWDVDTNQENIPFWVQGVLFLADVAENGGTFQCVPGFHKRFHEWAKAQPADRDPRKPDLTGLSVKRIPGKAGDLVIWVNLLPHGNSRNESDRPRLAQFISMSPARENDENARKRRINLFENQLPPDGSAFPGDTRGWEKANYDPPKLTPLGRKLLGVESWDAYPP